MAQDEPCMFLFKQIHDAMEKRANNDMREIGLTFSQAFALRELSASPARQMSMKELEKALHVAQSSTARIIQNMERGGIVESFGDASDKRVKYVRLTEKGALLDQSARKKKEEDDAALFSGFSAEEKQLFLSMLQRIWQNIVH